METKAECLERRAREKRGNRCARLKNGSEEQYTLVKVTMFSLGELMKSAPLAVYELAELAKDRDHVVLGTFGEVACRLGLAQRTQVEPASTPGAYQLHDSIRNIILNAIEGEGLQMRLVSPIAPQPPGESEVTG